LKNQSGIRPCILLKAFGPGNLIVRFCGILLFAFDQEAGAYGLAGMLAVSQSIEAADAAWLFMEFLRVIDVFETMVPGAKNVARAKV